MRQQDAPGRADLPHPPAGRVDLHQATAAAHGGRGSQFALAKPGAVRAAAADIDISEAGKVLARIFGRPRAAPGDRAFHVRPGHRDHKITRQPGGSFQHLVGILLAGGLAGDDSRPCFHLLRLDTRGGILGL